MDLQDQTATPEQRAAIKQLHNDEVKKTKISWAHDPTNAISSHKKESLIYWQYVASYSTYWHSYGR